jgi:phosphoserine phosphatase RsbU/P
MLSRLRIGTRLGVLVAVGAVAILGLVETYSYWASHGLLRAELLAAGQVSALAAAERIEGLRRSAEASAFTLARAIKDWSADEATIRTQMENVLRANPGLFGTAVAMAPSGLRRAVYAHRQGEAIRFVRLEGPRYDYPRQAWFERPARTGTPSWSEPYVDRGGGEVAMTTFSVPCLDPDGLLRAVVTGDISLDWIGVFLRDLPVARLGGVLVLSKQGRVLADTRGAGAAGQSVLEATHQRWRAAARRMSAGESDVVEVESPTGPGAAWLAFAPAGSSGWSVGVWMPRAMLEADVEKLTRTELMLGALGALMLVGFVVLAARAITRPIARLERATAELARGHLDRPMPEASGSDEVATLTRSFALMQHDLQDHVRRLKQAEAARQRVQAELRIAHDIQQSLVPRQFPALPGIDLDGRLEPAREVGGDFYDVSLVDERWLYLAVGDVSDKGVPAALMMAAARSFLRMLARAGGSPGAVLAQLNSDLCDGNDSSMFLTLLLARIELATGRCEVASAGHPAPLRVGADGKVSELPRLRGAPLGICADVALEEHALQLQPSDALLLYTDGLSELRVGEAAWLGVEGIRTLLERLAGLSSRQCLDQILAEARRIAAGELPDDIALVHLRWLRG